MKKIVLISYVTYPGTSPRQLRTDELAKELARQGHKVTLYVLKGDFNYDTYEKENNIIIKELGPTYLFKFSHKKGSSLNKTHIKILRKLIGRYIEYPHIELIKNSYKALKKENDIDLLISIGSPHPIHWGVALYRSINKKKLKNTIWVSDCGDPYMGNSLIKPPFYFKYVEKFFCRKTDYISIPIEEAKNGYYPEFLDKIKIIPQGFNFEKIKINKNFIKNQVPTFIYAGTFYRGLRDPRPLLDYLSSLNENFKFIVYTKNIKYLQKHKTILGDKLEIHDYIPREKLIFEMSKSDFLINLENPSKNQSPSKLIDYALSGRPILSINTNKEIDKKLIYQFIQGNYEKSFKIDNIEKYNIKNVANEFLKLLN